MSRNRLRVAFVMEIDELGELSGFPIPGARNRVRIAFVKEIDELGTFSGFPIPASRNRTRIAFVIGINELGELSGFLVPGSRNRVRIAFVKEINELGTLSGFPIPVSRNRVRVAFVKQINELGKLSGFPVPLFRRTGVPFSRSRDDLKHPGVPRKTFRDPRRRFWVFSGPLMGMALGSIVYLLSPLHGQKTTPCCDSTPSQIYAEPAKPHRPRAH